MTDTHSTARGQLPPRTPRGRILLLPVKDSEACEAALKWTLEHLYRQGDFIHLYHVVLKAGGADSGAFTAPTQHMQVAQMEQAQAFCSERYTSMVEQAGAQSKAEVVQKDIDKNALGEAICKRADDLPAAVVAMAASSRGKRIRYVLGPTTEYCVGRCAHPVLVYHC